ncbi:hypothetical protein AKO1_008103 [Acrasis kona]|uniref:RING-type domain-containing protein n=1 Tax=Acrasis kona TaxID=1008807 RepID=A0AAW2YPI7_9EUKA
MSQKPIGFDTKLSIVGVQTPSDTLLVSSNNTAVNGRIRLASELEESFEEHRPSKRVKAPSNLHVDCSATEVPVSDNEATTQAAAEEEAIECSVCYEEIKKKGIIDSCSHIFCFDCIFKWSSSSSECPVCKQKFKSITPHDLVEGNQTNQVPILVQNRTFSLGDEYHYDSEEDEDDIYNRINDMVEARVDEGLFEMVISGIPVGLRSLIRQHLFRPRLPFTNTRDNPVVISDDEGDSESDDSDDEDEYDEESAQEQASHFSHHHHHHVHHENHQQILNRTLQDQARRAHQIDPILPPHAPRFVQHNFFSRPETNNNLSYQMDHLRSVLMMQRQQQQQQQQQLQQQLQHHQQQIQQLHQQRERMYQNFQPPATNNAQYVGSQNFSIPPLQHFHSPPIYPNFMHTFSPTLGSSNFVLEEQEPDNYYL